VSQECVQPTIHCTHLKCVTGMRATHNTLHSPYVCHRNACNSQYTSLTLCVPQERVQPNPQYTALTLCVPQERVQPTIHRTHLMCATGMRATHNTPHSPPPPLAMEEDAFPRETSADECNPAAPFLMQTAGIPKGVSAGGGGIGKGCAGCCVFNGSCVLLG